MERKGRAGDLVAPFALLLFPFNNRLCREVNRLILGIEPVNEIVAQAYSTRTVPAYKNDNRDGGRDSKLIFLGKEGRAIKDFSMNSVCAAGTGSFLDQQAERLRLTIEEFSELALKSENPRGSREDAVSLRSPI